MLLWSATLFLTSVSAFTAPQSPLRGGSNTALLANLKSDKFAVGILGDLHIDPRYMDDYYTGRDQWKKVLETEAELREGNTALVSLGDLGESKSVRPEETHELFAGTTECHEMAAEFLGSFGVPYELVGGNHGT
jgi:hypothetical protein